jgi:hypothetical protein
VGTVVRDLLFGRRKILRQILPRWVISFNKPNLLLAAPALDFYLACNGITNVRKRFAMDQPEDFVSGGKSRDESLPVFNHPALEVVGYAGVQVSGPAG